jgi:nicotinamide-nucleotide amidase
LIAVGSELLSAGRRDSNAHWLAERLDRLGIALVARGLVVDESERIASLLAAALRRSELIVVTGGIGPTADDVTREAVARALDRPLERDLEQVNRLMRRFAAFGRRFGPEQLKQADRPRGATWIDNPRGSAPGLLVIQDNTILCVLPGVPSEMKAMFLATLEPELERRSRRSFARSVLKIAGRSEPSVDRAIADLYDAPGREITILSGIGGIELLLRTDGADAEAARSALESVEREIRRRLGVDIFGRDDDTLAEVVGALLLERHLTLSTAESCTGGLLGAAVTGVPGSSAWYRGGLVVYSDALKQDLAGVSSSTLVSAGAVSEATAVELARGARHRCGSDIGVGVTGVAGPGGGTDQKPVGRVHLALSDADADLHWQMDLPGDRADVRGRSVTVALDRLRRHLLARGHVR